MKRVFLDTNLLLDLIDARRPEHESALKLEAVMERDNLHGLLAWHSLSIIEYVGGRKFGHDRIHKVIRGFLETFTVPPTGTEDARAAFHHLDSDYEDALQIASAIAGKADVIVTHDTSGFTKSPIKVVTPDDFLILADKP